MIYTIANREDVPGVARVLMESFADSIDRAFGRMPSAALFEHAVALARDVEPRALIVARHGRIVVGFVFAPHSLAAMRRVSLLRGHALRWLWQWPSGWRRVRCSPLQLMLPFTDRAMPVPAWRPPHEGCILSVAVSPGKRGRGVGTILVRHALTYLRHRNVHRARVELPRGHRPASRLFGAAGFSVVGADGSPPDRLVMLYDFQSGEAARDPVGLRA